MATTHSNPNERLEPLEPTEAARLWRESRENELADATLQTRQYQVDQFVDWLAEEQDIDDMRELTGRTVHEFKIHLQDDVQPNTVAQRVSTVVRLLKFCVSLNAVPPHVPEQIELPKRRGEPRTESLDEDAAELALQYHRKFAYASKFHTLLTLTWHTGLRTGTLRSLDVDDVEESENRLRVRHRPDDGTPLKNGDTAERYVTLSNEVTEVIGDWIDHSRHDVTDDYGREPLFTTKHGRASINTIRRWFESATRPCAYGEGCPHDRDPSDCGAANAEHKASDCPSSVSGHPVRRGAITRFLRDEVPEKVVSDRMNVSQDVIDKHYDRRTDDEKAEQRREFIEGL